MASNGRSQTLLVALPAADATALAASATENRYIKQLHFTNTSAAAITVNVGVAATYATGTSIADDLSIAANSVSDIYLNQLKVVNTNIRAFASATGVTMALIYDAELL